MRKFCTIFVISSLLVSPNGFAVNHLIPGTYPHHRKDDIHHPNPNQIRRFGSLQAAIIGAKTGPKNVAVVLVQFPAGNSSLISGSRSIQSFFNVQSYFNQMASYYNEVSYHKISLTFRFFGNRGGAPLVNTGGELTAAAANAYTLALPMESYGCGDEGVGCTSVTAPGPNTNTTVANGDYLIRDAIIAARNDGYTGLSTANFDAIIVMHAGNGNETTQGTPGDIWSIFYSQDSDIIGGQGFTGASSPDVQPQAEAAGFTEGDVVPETQSSGITSPLGVMCHEFGHELGLPDEYNTSAQGGSSVVGTWEIMDAGPFDGGGANPAHMSAWDKTFLGWVTPTTVISKIDNTLGFVETSPTIIKLPVQNGSSQEYFLVEYRSRSATGAQFDHSIPGTGLLVWHIDDAITSTRGIDASNPLESNTVNTGTPHYGISIIPADGIPVSSNEGDGGNAYQTGQVFTAPSSNNFAGAASGISLVNIAGVGSNSVSFDVANLAVSAGQSILQLQNYPNPAGKGYPHPSGLPHTTIQFQVTRPATDYSMNIYTLSGELVRKIAQSDITLNIDRSGNDKWVYEFEWDLTNGNGAMVAPGVYFYLIRVDGQTRTGKAVIIR